MYTNVYPTKTSGFLELQPLRLPNNVVSNNDF